MKNTDKFFYQADQEKKDKNIHKEITKFPLL